jgi:hypothetical protein
MTTSPALNDKMEQGMKLPLVSNQFDAPISAVMP